MGTRKSNWLAKLMCAEPSKQSQHLVEFWQREAHRYEATSRRLVTRMRVEVALSLPILISIMTIAFGNEQLIVLLAVPPLVAIVGSLVLWTVQESFSADAHLHYAETMVAQNIATYDSKYPAWSDHGGKLGRTGYPFRLVIGVWGVVAVGGLYVSLWNLAYVLWQDTLFWAVYVLSVTVLVLLGLGCSRVVKAEKELRRQLETLLSYNQ